MYGTLNRPTEGFRKGATACIPHRTSKAFIDEVKSYRPVNFTDSKHQELFLPVAAEILFAQHRAAPSPTKALTLPGVLIIFVY